MENYIYTGDMDIEHGGMWLDVSAIDDGYVACIRVTPLGSAAGYDGAYLIENGSIFIPDDKEKLQSIYDCWGNVPKDAIELAQACEAYHGIEVDSWNGTIVVRESNAAESFDSWEANEVLDTSLADYLTNNYGVAVA